MSLERARRTLELPGANRLRDAQATLDRAVAKAYRYGLPREMAGLEPLALLLALNRTCAAAEKESLPVVGPGLPAFCDGDSRFSSDDCRRMPVQ